MFHLFYFSAVTITAGFQGDQPTHNFTRQHFYKIGGES